MAFCNTCGTELPENTKFCTHCGGMVSVPTAVPAQSAALASEQSEAMPNEAYRPTQSLQDVQAPQSDPVQYHQTQTPQVQSAPGPQQQQQYAPPQPQYMPAANGDVPPPPGSIYSVMGVGAYIGMSILFSLPVIGWIACIVMAFASKNLNRRNFARAMLVFMIVGCVFVIILWAFVNWLISMVNAAAGGLINSFAGELLNNFNIDTGNLDDLQRLVEGYNFSQYLK